MLLHKTWYEASRCTLHSQSVDPEHRPTRCRLHPHVASPLGGFGMKAACWGRRVVQCSARVVSPVRCLRSCFKHFSPCAPLRKAAILHPICVVSHRFFSLSRKKYNSVTSPVREEHRTFRSLATIRNISKACKIKILPRSFDWRFFIRSAAHQRRRFRGFRN